MVQQGRDNRRLSVNSRRDMQRSLTVIGLRLDVGTTESSTATTDCSPLWAVKCRGVVPSWSSTSMWVPQSNAARTSSTSTSRQKTQFNQRSSISTGQGVAAGSAVGVGAGSGLAVGARVGPAAGIAVGNAATTAAVVGSATGFALSEYDARKTAKRLNTLASAANHRRDGFAG